MPLFQRYGQVTECDVLGSYGFVVSAVNLSFFCDKICALRAVNQRGVDTCIGLD